MSDNDLARLYQEAASAEEAAEQASAPSNKIEEISFKLQACVTWARVQLHEAGFETQQQVYEDAPELLLNISRDGNVHHFRLCVPQQGHDNDNQPLFSKNVILAGNADGSLSSFKLYEDDGSISIRRFEDLSAEIARHVAIECGKKANIRNAPAAAL